MVALRTWGGKICVQMMATGGNLRAERVANNGAATLIAEVAYNATNHRWWRIREAAGTIFFEAWAARQDVADRGRQRRGRHDQRGPAAGHDRAGLRLPAPRRPRQMRSSTTSTPASRITKAGTAAARGAPGGGKLATHQSVKTGAGVPVGAPGGRRCGNAREDRGVGAARRPGGARPCRAPGCRHRAAALLLPRSTSPGGSRWGCSPSPRPSGRRPPSRRRSPLGTLTLPPTIRPGYAGGPQFATLRLG